MSDIDRLIYENAVIIDKLQRKYKLRVFVEPKLFNKFINKILIIGGGPVGLLASITLKKLGYEITVVEKRVEKKTNIYTGTNSIVTGRSY